ncbi:MAG: dipeptidase [Chitinophagaceae bacterium]|nr:dipeptidase [Chitinophagaceae bacterium]
MQKSILLISSSSVAGSGYLDPFEETIKTFLKDISEILFVPYAADKTNWDFYTQKVRDRFKPFGITVKGIHEVDNNIENFNAIFIGGGNTFRLLNRLQEFDLLSKINNAVLTKGMRYIGSSAGSNIACKTICTTNDMPIVYPAKGFDGINLIPLQINPHYIDPDPNSTHMGETRDDRIKEFHEANNTPVIGLREGAFLKIDDEYFSSKKMFLGGTNGAKFFFPGKSPIDIRDAKEIIITPDSII